VIIACEDRTVGVLPNGTTVEDWAVNEQGVVFATISGIVDPTAAADTQLQLLEGTPPIFSIPYSSMVVDDVAPAGAPQAGDFIGALSQSEDQPVRRLDVRHIRRQPQSAAVVRVTPA
jgi:hypothetical protein